MTKQIECPDFDDLFKLSDKIKQLLLKSGLLENEIQLHEKEIILKARSDKSLWESGKMPSMDFIKKTYMFSGFNNELISLRNELVKLESELLQVKNDLDLNKMLIEVYRTQSANQRRSEV